MVVVVVVVAAEAAQLLVVLSLFALMSLPSRVRCLLDDNDDGEERSRLSLAANHSTSDFQE